MTSNLGSELIQEQFSNTEQSRETAEKKAKALVINLLKQKMRPEFLNRIDEMVLFHPLSRKEVRKIVKLQLDGINQKLLAQQIDLTITPQAMDRLSQEGFDPEFGARPIKRVIQRRVLNEISKQILTKKIVPGKPVVLDAFEGKLVFREPLAK